MGNSDVDKIYRDSPNTFSTNFLTITNKKKSILFVLARQLRNAIKCPGYSDIYGQYNKDSSFEKCDEWSNKLQFPAAGEMDKQEPIQSRTHKVYDSMKSFLQRKLFAQPSHKEQILNEEPTSDYDEVCIVYGAIILRTGL